MRPLYYILVETIPVAINPEDPVQLEAWLQSQHEDRHVAEENFFGLWVSTVFLGIDHNHTGRGPPILFETMVFVEFEEPETREIEFEGYTYTYTFDAESLEDEFGVWRYATWEEAEKGHKEMLNAIRRRFLKVVNGD